MTKLTFDELLSLKGGASDNCMALLQYEANTHEEPDCEDPELVAKLEKEYWDDWAKRFFDCAGYWPES